MEGKEKTSIEKWVDLSELPRFKNGQSSLIDWEKSIGYNIPFKYDSICGEIQIIGHRKKCVGTNGKKHSFLTIMIDKYMLEPVEIQTSVIRQCKLYNFLHDRIIDMRPELVQFLANPNDAYTISYKSNACILTKCPICGHERLYVAETLSNNGFSCPICKDGISYPNKFIANMLKQLKINFRRELSKKDNDFKWAKKYRYDFAFEIGGVKYIIEADGGRHKQQQKQDAVKTQLAIENGFYLIRINCDYGSKDKFEFLKHSILNSELASLFDLCTIDWNQCHQLAVTNLTKQACDMWENTTMRVIDIARVIGVSNVTVTSYLKLGKKIGICPSYNTQNAILRNAEYKSKPIAYFNGNILKYVFKNSDEAEKVSTSLLGKYYSKQTIQRFCRRQYNKELYCNFCYITKEEYEQYKMVNNIAFREGVV